MSRSPTNRPATGSTRSRNVQPPDLPSSQYQQMHGLTQRRGRARSEQEDMPVESATATREQMQRTRTDTPPTGARGKPPPHQGGARPTGSGNRDGGAGDAPLRQHQGPAGSEAAPNPDVDADER